MASIASQAAEIHLAGLTNKAALAQKVQEAKAALATLTAQHDENALAHRRQMAADRSKHLADIAKLRVQADIDLANRRFEARQRAAQDRRNAQLEVERQRHERAMLRITNAAAAATAANQRRNAIVDHYRQRAEDLVDRDRLRGIEVVDHYRQRAEDLVDVDHRDNREDLANARADRLEVAREDRTDARTTRRGGVYTFFGILIMALLFFFVYLIMRAGDKNHVEHMFRALQSKAVAGQPVKITTDGTHNFEITVPQPPVVALPAPAPAPVPAVPEPVMDHPIRKDVAAGLVERQLAAYVPTKDNAVYGLVTEISPGRTVLYRLEGDLYQVVNQVSENVTVDGLTVVSDEQMVRLQDILAR